MRRFVIILSLILSAQWTSAQNFYNTPSDARATAMGGVSMAVTGDAYATSTNPSAALFGRKTIQAAFGYTKFSGEPMRHNRMMSFAVYGKVENRHLFAAGGNFGIEPILEYSGKRPGVQRYEVAYGYKATERFAFAVTARYARTYGHYRGGCIIWDFNTGGIDFSVTGQLPTKILDGAAVATLGAKLTGCLGGSMPEYDIYIFGASVGGGLVMPFTDSHSLEIGVDAKYGWAGDCGHMVYGGIGAEYTLMQLLYFRIGGNITHYTDPYVDYRTIGYGTIGVGVRFFHLQLDVSYSAGRRNAPMANMFQFSVGLDF